jgi:hypothetical protein
MSGLDTTDLVGIGVTLLGAAGFLWLSWEALQAMKN